MANKLLSRLEVSHLADIVRRHCPARLDVVAKIGKAPLSEEEREEFREAVASELVLVGLTPDGEPNAVGLELEALIDKLGNA